jgi:glucose/arabinose dehydrogenase
MALSRLAFGSLAVGIFTQAGAQPSPELRTRQIASGLSYPSQIAAAHDGSGRLFVVEQPGTVRILEFGEIREPPFLEIIDRVSCCGEDGLLSIAFDPADRRHVYAYYVDLTNHIVISRFTLSPDGQTADGSSEQRLLVVQPKDYSHYGGQLAFGPDGLLYAGIGDGGAGEGDENPAPLPESYLGKILRIALDRDPPTAEIWARGLRNPWRFSFDRLTGDLFIADVGQSGAEEVDYEPFETREAGRDYGWNRMEGTLCNLEECGSAGEPPIAEYDHSEGCSITGGFVYRGSRIPALYGAYVFGDYCSGRIWGLRRDGETWARYPLLETGAYISTFGEDEQGELYFTDHRSGAIYRIEGAAGPSRLHRAR